MSKSPGFWFFTGDWMKDTELRFCSLFARGLLVDLLCLMFESKRQGFLCKADGSPRSNIEIVHSISGGSTEEKLGALAELESSGVLSRDEQGVLYSRRISRLKELSEKRKESGKRGGKQTQAKLKQTAKQTDKQPEKQNAGVTVSVTDTVSDSFLKPVSVNTELQVETPSPVGAGVSSEEDPCDFAILSCNVNAWPAAFAEVRVPSALAIFQNDALAWAKWLRDNDGPNFDASKLQKDLQAAVKIGDRFPQAVSWAIDKRKDKLPQPKHDPPKRINFEAWHQMRLTFDVGKNPMALKDEFGTEALDAWLKLAKRHMNKNLSDEEARRAFAQEFLSEPGIDLANEFFEILGELNNG